jgi:hypothetical protein
MRLASSLLAPAILISACAGPPPPAPAAAHDQVSAAVAAQIRRCYRMPRIPSAGRRIVTRLLVRYGPDGTLVGLPLLVRQEGVTAENQRYSGRMAEAATQAVIGCSPVSLPEEPARDSEFYLTFSPQLSA